MRYQPVDLSKVKHASSIQHKVQATTVNLPGHGASALDLIQSFPDSWEFVGSISSQYKQIGNAVPVNLAKAVAKELVKSLLHPELVATIRVQSKIKHFV